MLKNIFINVNFVKDMDRYFLFLGYKAKATTDDVVLNKAEHSEFEWISLEELKNTETNHMYIQETLKTFSE